MYKRKQCFPLDSRGHQGLDGQRGRTMIEAALNCRMMDKTDGMKLKGGKQLKCSDQSLWASALIPTEPGHRNIELNLSSK